jgi:hypothetical protein
MVVNTDLGWVFTQAGGIATFVLACAIVRLMVFFVARDVSESQSTSGNRQA